MGGFIIDKFYLFFEGIMLFQVIFFGMVYFTSKRKDALYYALLNVAGSMYFFLNAPDTFLGISENIVFNSPYYPSINFVLLLSIVLMYAVFLGNIFNDSLEKYAYLKKVFSLTIYSVPVLCLLFVLFSALGWNANFIFYIGHIINAPFCTLILLLNYKEKGYKALVINGMLVTFLCTTATVIFIMRYNAGSNETILDKYPLALVKLGMLIDIILFQLALVRKWNNQEKELATEKLQSQLAVEKLRNKISGELHDDIGSTLSGVSMYSHMARQEVLNGNIDAATNALDIIQAASGQVINNLNYMVWSIHPGNDNLQSLIDKIYEYATFMTGAKNMRLVIENNTASVQGNVSTEWRHNMFMIAKEAINNAVKYSNASSLYLHIEKQPAFFKIEIKDKGTGYTTGANHSGNGLKNMKSRAEEIGGDLSIQSNNNGTSVNLFIKMTQ